MFRRDRSQLTKKGRPRKGGGIAIYVENQIQVDLHKPQADTDSRIESLWLRFKHGDHTCFVGGIYHPPNPVYTEDEIVRFIENTIDEIAEGYQGSSVILTGDFNQLSETRITSLGLIHEQTAPTRGRAHLDKLFTSEPLFDHVLVMGSTVKSDHKAIYAHSSDDVETQKSPKINTQVQFRAHTPALRCNLYIHSGSGTTRHVSISCKVQKSNRLNQ